MKLAIIENNKCVNVIKSKEMISIPGNEVVVAEHGYGIGDLFSNGVWSKDPINESEDFEKAKDSKQQEINSGFKGSVSDIIDPSVTYEEQQTFLTQEKEARAWQSDNNADVPNITILATNRGISLSDLVPRIIAKADAYSQAVFKLMGQKHAFEDLLSVAETVEDVSSINIEYHLT